MNKITIIKNKNLFFILLTPILFVGIMLLIDIPVGENRDKREYQYAYETNDPRFEFGYNLLQNIFIGLDQDFEIFWKALLIILTILILKCYNKISFSIIAIPNFIYLHEYLFSAQIRFSIACMLTVLALKSQKKIHAIFLSCFAMVMHYGVILIIAQILLINAMRLSNFFIKIIQIALPLVIISLVINLNFINLNFIIESVISNTRFVYYLGTEYFEAKSKVSIAYAGIMLFLITIAIKKYNLYGLITEQKEYRIIYLTHASCLASVLILSDFAVISGRILNFTFLLEPIIIYGLFRIRSDFVIIAIRVAMIMLSSAKLLSGV